MVDMVRAHHEGSHFDSDVFLAEQGLLPVATARAAHIVVTARPTDHGKAKAASLRCTRTGSRTAP